MAMGLRVQNRVRFGNQEPFVLSTKGFGKQYQNSDSAVVRKAIDVAAENNAMDVLDLAAGQGVFSLALAKARPQSRIMATDIDEAGLQAIHQQAKADALPIETMPLDAAVKSLPETLKSKFDLVVAKDLYPFLNPRQIGRLLKNVSDALKPGGWFVMTAPSTESMLYRKAVFRNNSTALYQKLSQSARNFVPTTRPYFSFATIEHLAKQLRKAGMTMTEAFHYGQSKGWITLVARKGS